MLTPNQTPLAYHKHVLLQALQRTCTNLRNERSQAHDAEHQALVRAAAFESDRDKIQRQFKV